MNLKGRFIVIEGLDYTGKTSVVNELSEIVSKDVIFTREPGGLNNNLAEKVRDLIFENNMTPITEAYLFAASRAEHISKVRPLLMEGKTVICDRFVYSSLYYQGYLKEIGTDTVYDLNKPALLDIEPDIIFLFTVSQEEKLRRMKERTEVNRLDIETENINIEKASDEYKGLIARYKPINSRLIIVDTSKHTPREIAEALAKYI